MTDSGLPDGCTSSMLPGQSRREEYLEAHTEALQAAVEEELERRLRQQQGAVSLAFFDWLYDAQGDIVLPTPYNKLWSYYVNRWLTDIRLHDSPVWAEQMERTCSTFTEDWR